MKHNFMNKENGKVASVLVMYLDDEGHMQTDYYDKVEDLMEDYAAYKPARPEPLIKDEKIRKAVGVWADTYGIVAVRHIVLSFDKTKHSVFETGYGRDYSAITLETELDFVDGDTYTITELCGEEEE